MTLFINLRASPSGGLVAAEAAAWDDGTTWVAPDEFARRVQDRDVLFATHGFNVDQASGIRALSTLEARCELPGTWLFVGVLWAGDSRLFPLVDYVYEGVEAIASGQLLARYLNENSTGAQSCSFVSHSLGARTVLETVRHLGCRPRRVILMAGAIENDCLDREYADAAARAEQIYVIGSREDDVLRYAFPPGNLIGEIIMHGHPYDRTALGRRGPARPIAPDQQGGAWQIPKAWNYGHLDYLSTSYTAAQVAQPVPAPGPDTEAPADEGWKPAWAAAAISTQVR